MVLKAGIEGIATDPAAALVLFEKSCKGSSAVGCFNASTIYLKGARPGLLTVLTVQATRRPRPTCRRR
jgi:hypothetical protein